MNDPAVIPTDDHDPEPYVKPTLAQRMAHFDATTVRALMEAPPAAPITAPPVVYRPIPESLEKIRVCLDCKLEFVGLLTICGDCSEARLLLESQAKERARRKVRGREWCVACPPDYRSTDWRRVGLSKACVDLALNWRPGTAQHSLCIHGETGLGKTRAAFAILSRFHEVGWSVYALHAGDAWDKLPEVRGLASAARLQYDDDTKVAQGARECLRRARVAQILLLDDIGKERAGSDGLLSEAVSEAFFSLVEFRLAHQMPTIWTCNSDADTLLARFGEDRGRPLMRRLFDVSQAPIIS